MPPTKEQLQTIREFFFPRDVKLVPNSPEDTERADSVTAYVNWQLEGFARKAWDYVLEEAAKALDLRPEEEESILGRYIDGIARGAAKECQATIRRMKTPAR